VANDSDASVSYQWQANHGAGFANIAGATGLSYVVSAADLGAQLKIIATSTDSDGSGTTSTSAATSIPVDTAPVLKVLDLTALPGQSFAASSLFTASDPDGDAFSIYAFWDTGTDGGHFVLNGVAQKNNQEIDVTAAQLAQLSFQSGWSAHTLLVRGYDGNVWSDWSIFTVAGVDRTIPVVTQVVASPSSGIENPGTLITLTLDLSEAATITGMPTLTLNDGGTATYSSGTGTNALTFSYTVGLADNSVSTLGITQINLPAGATVADTAGDAADLSGALTTFPGLGIDPPSHLKFVGVDDFVAGGLADVAWQNGGGAALWVSNGTALTQSNVPKGAMGSEWTVNGVGDFNSDRNADLLWTTTDGRAAIWEMNGANLVGFGVPAGQMSAGWQVAGVGDFNGDGRSDILWTNSGAATIWTMNGTTLVNSAISNGRMGAEWQVVGIGDFNNDGRSDVLWEDTSGQVAVWEMNGANLSGFDWGWAQMPPGWKIGGVGHFSGAADSTSDVVWVNGTNHVQIWQMNHGKLADVITPNGLDGTEWHLEGVGNFVAGDANSDLLWISDSGAVNIWGVNGSQVRSTIPDAPTGSTLQLGNSTTANSTALSSGAPAGDGNLTIANNTKLELIGTSKTNVTFLGPTGTLKLDNSLAFAGHVSGLSAADALDLSDIRYGANTRATFSGNTNGGVLAVTDGSSTSHIALLGNYTTSGWTLSSDANGGTFVVDPPLTASGAGDPSAVGQQLALLNQCMASPLSNSSFLGAGAPMSYDLVSSQGPLLTSPAYLPSHA
jgi:hypothetical protein